MSTFAQPIKQVTNLPPVEAARFLPCGFCYAPAGTPCRTGPDRDHFARYVEAEADGNLTRAQLTRVMDRLAVISTRVLVEAVA